MSNREIAKLLRKIAIIYQLTDENRFKIIAYQNAADSIENCSQETEDLYKSGKMTGIDGVGKTITSHLDELFRTGKVRHFESVLKKVPSSIFPLLEVSGIGPKKAYRLVTTFGLNNPQTVIEELLKLTQQGKIAVLDGFGDRSETEMKEALERFQKNQKKELRILLSTASEIAADVVDYLLGCAKVQKIEILGSLRRRVETIGDIDIAVATREREAVIKWFLGYSKAKQIVEKGSSGATIMLSDGIKVDLRVISLSSFGSMLQYFTGSKNHNISLREFALKKGLSLSEYGIKPIDKSKKLNLKDTNYNSKLKIYEYESEKKFYQALGLQWIAPELRENRGEIEVFKSDQQAPVLIEQSEIKGDLHLHSDFKIETSHDLGNSSFQDLLYRAQKKNYQYIGISDHNPSHSNHSKSEIISILKRRKDYFEHLYYSIKSTRVKYFLMLEVDILSDGTIPLPEKAIEYLDAFIVSIHSSFRLEREVMTDRVLKALSHPKAKILAHPTGRLINSRDGYALDWERIFEFAIKNNKALEVNSCPTRLDLTDIMVRECIKRGVKIVINTDSHDESQMEFMKYGIDVARRGWATKNDIINTADYEKIKSWMMD